MNYYAILLYKRDFYAENDAIKLVFQVYNDLNTLQTNLSAFKIQAKISNGLQMITKQDANYDDGSDVQILVSDDKITVHIVTGDSDNFEGIYALELQIEKIADSTFRQTIYLGEIKFYTEVLED